MFAQYATLVNIPFHVLLPLDVVLLPPSGGVCRSLPGPVREARKPRPGCGKDAWLAAFLGTLTVDPPAHSVQREPRPLGEATWRVPSSSPTCERISVVGSPPPSFQVFRSGSQMLWSRGRPSPLCPSVSAPGSWTWRGDMGLSLL